MTKPPLTLQMPSPPDPVPVVLNPATTALLIFDIVDPICTRQPNCTGKMVPAISSLLARARQAGVTVAFGTRAPTMSKWLPEVLPAPGDIKIESQAQDRFYNTDLDKVLKAKGITTLILAGWKVSGSVTYTSVGATLRVVRVSSLRPSLVSSARIVWLKADWDTPSCAAARVKLRSRATAMKASRSLKFSRCIDEPTSYVFADFNV